MILKNILKEIGFRDRMSKGVDDESKAEFQDFGEYVGKLYQDFQDKDLRSKPEVAQKIRDLVSVEDESSLINQIKDLEFLINQLPDKPEPGKIGFRQNEDYLAENLNPEVLRALDRFIKSMAKRYDYSERDAVFAIKAAMKQRDFDGVNEMTNDEFEKAKEADRLEKHPERDKIKKIQQMISREKQLKESLQRRAGING